MVTLDERVRDAHTAIGIIRDVLELRADMAPHLARCRRTTLAGEALLLASEVSIAARKVARRADTVNAMAAGAAGAEGAEFLAGRMLTDAAALASLLAVEAERAAFGAAQRSQEVLEGRSGGQAVSP